MDNYNISLIVCHDSKGGIGKNGKLPWNVPEDLALFREITIGKNKNNVVIMGRKTWDSIPDKFRPLRDRVNIVFTKETRDEQENVHFVSSMEECAKIIGKLERIPDEVFAIGGSQIYKMFGHIAKKSYVTVLSKDHQCDTFFNAHVDQSEPNWQITNTVQLSDDVIHFQKERRQNVEEQQYLNLLQSICQNGVSRPDRTGVGTRSIFCPQQLRFNLSNGVVPLLTTKRVPWKTVIRELLWFLRGDTDAKILQKEKVKIWDGNSTREFLDKRGLTNYPEGVLGPVYGHQWRHFGAEYDPLKEKQEGGYDQIAAIIDMLQNDPYSRRLVVSAWNPPDLDKSALPPCHNYFEFYVVDGKRLSLHFHMRGTDTFLGNPFNIFSYAVLLHIIAKKVDMEPFELICTIGDAHVYNNHLEQAEIQWNREPYAFPTLTVSDEISKISIEEITIDHFQIHNYTCHPTIKAPMAI